MPHKLLFFALALLTLPAAAQVYSTTGPLAHTFSIVARDPKTGEMAVAVQSHWFSVGTSVSWGEAGVGVVVHQQVVRSPGLGFIEKRQIGPTGAR